MNLRNILLNKAYEVLTRVDEQLDEWDAQLDQKIEQGNQTLDKIKSQQVERRRWRDGTHEDIYDRK